MTPEEDARAFVEQRMSEATYRQRLKIQFQVHGMTQAAESVDRYTTQQIFGMAHRVLASS